MVNVKTAAATIGGLAAMKFFPSDDAARTAIVREVCEMAADDDQIRWLVRRALTVYNEWPGLRELRACFCSKFKPKDGINAYSTVYLDGIPSERESKGIAAPAFKALPPGATHSADKGLDIAIELAARTMEVQQSTLSGPATKEEIAAAPDWLRQLEGYDV